MTTKNSEEEEYEPVLDLVKEQMEKLDTIISKFGGQPDVQQKLQSAKDALRANEEEIMNYYDLTDLAKRKLN